MFKNIKKVSSKNFMLSFFAIILFTVFITPSLKAQDIPERSSFNVTLPEKIKGIANIEYFVNGISQGSTDGVNPITLDSGNTIRFLVKFEESAKNTYLKDVLINDENTSTNLELVTGIKEDGTFFTRSPEESETISTSTSCISEEYTISSDTTFIIPPFLKLNLTLDFSETDLTEDLKDIMNIECSANGVATSVTTVENEDEKKYIVEGIEPDANITLTLKPTNAFTQLKGLKITNSANVDIELSTTGAEGSTERTLTLENLKSDETLTITGLGKNTYSISGAATVEVTHGEGFEYTDAVTEGYCLTANGIYVEPEEYTFDNITENIELKIVEIKAANYKITPPSADSHVKIQLSGENEPSNKSHHTVTHNSSFSFKVVPDFGYNFDSGITVKSNGTELTANQEGTYTIVSITSNISISVTGAQPNTYSVKIPVDSKVFKCELTQPTDVTVNTEGNFTTTYGTDIEVKITPTKKDSLTDYSKCVTEKNFTFKNYSFNDTTTTVSFVSEDREENSYKFKISNITENTQVLISDTLYDRFLNVDFKSNLDDSNVFTCINENAELYSENKASVGYGDSIKFKIVPTSKYEISSNGLTVTVSGTASLSGPDENGYYTLGDTTSITSDTTVTVGGIEGKNIPVYITVNHPDLEITRVNGTAITSELPLTSYTAHVPYGTSDFSVTVSTVNSDTTVKEENVSVYPTLNISSINNLTDSIPDSATKDFKITFSDAIKSTTEIIIQQKSQSSTTKWRLSKKITVNAVSLDKNGAIMASDSDDTPKPPKNCISFFNASGTNAPTFTHPDANGIGTQQLSIGGNTNYNIGYANTFYDKYYVVVGPSTRTGPATTNKDNEVTADGYDLWAFGRYKVTIGKNTFTQTGTYDFKDDDGNILGSITIGRYEARISYPDSYGKPNCSEHFYGTVSMTVKLNELGMKMISSSNTTTPDGGILCLFEDINIDMLFDEKPQLCNCTIDFEMLAEMRETAQFVQLTENINGYSINNFDPLNTTELNGDWDEDEDKSLYFAVLYNDIYELESDGVSISPSGNFPNLDDIKKINLEYIENGALTNELPDGFTKYRIYKISKPRIDTAQVYISKFKLKSYEAKFFGEGSIYQNSNGTNISDANIEHEKEFSFSIKADTGFLNDEDTYIIISIGNASAKFYYYKTNSEQTECEILSKYLGDATITRQNGKFEINIKNITNNFTVLTFRNRDTRKVEFSLPEGLTYEVVSGNNATGNVSNIVAVPYNNNFEFRIVATDPKYDLSNISVTANSSPISLINNKYKLKEVTENIIIRVENLQIIKNKVIFTQYDYVTYKNENGILLGTENEVDYGESLAFKVVLSEHYSNSEITVKFEDENSNKGDIKLPSINTDNNQSADTEIVSHSETSENSPHFSIENRIITIEKVTSNTRIFISDLKPNNYKIELVHHEGIKYYDETRQNELKDSENLKASTEQNSTVVEITYGENFKFSIISDDGYDISNIKVYYIGDNKDKIQKVLAVVDNVYTLENISENYKIIIEDVKKSVHQIEFRTVTGVNALDLFGKKITGTQNINYGETYTFKISLESAYNHSNPKVMIKGGNEIQPSNNGEYTTPPIKENIIIEILDVEKNSYTVTFKDAEGVIYQNAKNKPFTGQQKIEYDGIFEFKISLMDAYDSSTPLVTINGNNDDIIESSSSNKFEYVLQGVESDIEIIVKNVVRNPEEITIEMVNDVPDKVVTENDVDAVVKATNIYTNLSDEEREKVTNIADLQRAQKESAELTHSSGGMTAQNLDWNIRLVVTHLSDNEDKMKAFEKNVERREVLTLYDIKLMDILTGKEYDAPEDKEVTIELDAPNLDGYMNAVMAHQIANGNMEYLDLNVIDGTAYFRTSSFSLFGIAAKEIPNYSKNSSDLKISVKDLVENEEELKSLLGEGLVSQLGDILDEDNNTQSNPIDSFLKGNLNINELAEQTNLKKIYTWALENEFLAVILILLVGILLIWLILKTSKKQQKKS